MATQGCRPSDFSLSAYVQPIPLLQPLPLLYFVVDGHAAGVPEGCDNGAQRGLLTDTPLADPKRTPL